MTTLMQGSKPLALLSLLVAALRRFLTIMLLNPLTQETQPADPFLAIELLKRFAQESQRAEEKARILLRELLSEDERRHLERFGCLMIPSPGVHGRQYRVAKHPGLVEVYESNRLVMRLCVRPVEPLPSADLIVMLKLMIEANEDEYLRTANVHPAERGPWWRGLRQHTRAGGG